MTVFWEDPEMRSAAEFSGALEQIGQGGGLFLPVLPF